MLLPSTGFICDSWLFTSQACKRISFYGLRQYFFQKPRICAGYGILPGFFITGLDATVNEFGQLVSTAATKNREAEERNQKAAEVVAEAEKARRPELDAGLFPRRAYPARMVGYDAWQWLEVLGNR